MKFMSLSSSVFLVACLSIWPSYHGHPCGNVGFFEGLQEVTYTNTSNVKYQCHLPGYLIGSGNRICQRNLGVWNGNIPICVNPEENFIRNVSQSLKHKYQSDGIDAKSCLSDNDQQNSCIILPGDAVGRHVNITFTKIYRVIAVRLVGSKVDFQVTINIFMENSTIPGSSICKRDASLIDYFLCENPIEGDKMTVRFNSNISIIISLIEVSIFEKHDSTNCSIPDVPEYGSYKFDENRTTVSYQCKDGYILIGNDTSYCQPNGTWSQQAPICQETCAKPNISVKNGKWVWVNSNETQNATGVVTFDLDCEDGFEPDSDNPTTIQCQMNEGWTTSNASCVMVETTSPIPVTLDIEKTKVININKDESYETTSQNPVKDTETLHLGSTKLIIVGTVSGFVSSILVMIFVYCIIFGRKRCTRQPREPDQRRDSSYYHYYNGINYEEMDRATVSSTSTTISACVTNRPPAKDPRVPDILELVYENPSLYDQTSRNTSAVEETDMNECSRHIYSEVNYDEPNGSSSNQRDSVISVGSEVFTDNELYNEEL